MADSAQSQSTLTSHHTVFVIGTLLAAIFVLGQWDKAFLAIVSDTLTPVLAFIAFLSGVWAVVRVGVKRTEPFSFVWLSFVVAMALWLGSELAWLVYPLALGVVTPYPSIADVFGLAAYLPVMLGLVLQARPFRAAFRPRKIAIVVVPVLVLLVVVMFGVTSEILVQKPGALVLMVGLAYPILDLIALLVLGVCLLVFMRGTFWRPFVLLGIGLVFALSAHMLSVWANANGTYYSGHPLDLLFDYGYLCASFGFYLRAKQAKEMMTL
jgi:hypothetical protein